MFKKLHKPHGRIQFVVDDEEYDADQEDTVLSALLVVGIKAFCKSSVTGSARGPYCGIGACFDCLVTIEGEGKRQACLTSVRNGMKITTGEARCGLIPGKTR